MEGQNECFVWENPKDVYATFAISKTLRNSAVELIDTCSSSNQKKISTNLYDNYLTSIVWTKSLIHINYLNE